MTARKALFIEGGGGTPTHNAEEVRALCAAVLGGQHYDAISPAIGAIAKGHGVIGAGSMLVTANGTPNNTVHVAPGLAAVRGTQENDQGIYIVGNDADVVLNVANNPTNPRRDLVIAQVRDAQYPAHAGNDWLLSIVQGTPAGSPVDPAVPEDALVLARIRCDVEASITVESADLDDLRPRVVAAGGITPVNALADWPGPAEGDVLYRRDVDRLAIHNGSAWRHKDLMYVATGKTNLAFSAQASQSASGVSFGVTFASAPTIVTSSERTGIAPTFAVSLGTVTTSQFDVRATTVDESNVTGTVTVHWAAIGNLAT